MLSLFRKKKYLADLLRGFTDIHNHTLPGIDDGAKNLEDSVEILRKYKKLGINQIVCTPHVMNEYYSNTQETIHTAYDSLNKKIKNIPELTDTTINYAAEYMMDQHFLEIMNNTKLLTIKENFVLVEMSYFQAPINLNDILFKLQTKGYKPILAHPERYAFLHSKSLEKYKELKDRGCFFQMNLLSLTDHYGYNIQKMGKDLLSNNLIDFLGSDTHRVDHLEKIGAIKLSRKIENQVKAAITNTKSLF